MQLMWDCAIQAEAQHAAASPAFLLNISYYGYWNGFYECKYYFNHSQVKKW